MHSVIDPARRRKRLCHHRRQQTVHVFKRRRQHNIPLSRLRYLAGQIHSLGPRPLYELLHELARGADLASSLERYAGLEPLAEFIAHLGGDQLPRQARLVGRQQ
jgi:hypothetical protein